MDSNVTQWEKFIDNKSEKSTYCMIQTIPSNYTVQKRKNHGDS